MSGSDDLALEIVRAIAAAEGVEPYELDYSLHDYVATDALRSLAAMDNEEWELTVEVRDYTVTLDGSGRISVDGEAVQRSEAIRSDGTG